MSNKIKRQLAKAKKFERPEPLPLRRKVAQAEPFPMAALGPLAEGASAIAYKVHCAEAMAGTAVLAAATLACQPLADIIHPATGQKRPISLYFVSVAESGDRKSGVDAFALEPIKIREMDLRDRYIEKMRIFKNERAVYERQREHILKSMKDNHIEAAKKLNALGPEPVQPLEPVLTTDNATLEGIHRLLEKSEPYLGLYSDEGAIFTGGYSMQEESRGRTGAGLSALWDGKELRKSRSLDGTAVLRGRRFSMHLMMQPIFVPTFLADYMLQGQGLTSRILPSAPPSLIGTRMQRPPKPGTEAALKRYTKLLLDIMRQPQQRGGQDGAELCPRAIPLSSAARKRWSDFADECERAMARGGRFETIRGFANKLSEQALRISAVLELVNDVHAAEVSLETFDQAVILARYYASEALRLFEDRSASAEIVRAEMLLNWLHEKGKTAVWTGDICQNGPNPLREVRLIREALAVLEEHKWATRIEGGAEIDGKHHREAWEIVMR